jgi:hypothetical protein
MADIESEASPSSAERTLGIGLGVLAMVTLCVSLFVRAVAPYIPQDRRTATAVANLPAVAATSGSVVFMLGSSAIEMGVSPTLLDEELARLGRITTSYDFGFPHSTPSVLREVAEQARAAFAQQRHKAALTIVEFAPIITTRARRASMSMEEADRKMGEAASAHMLLNWIITSPNRGLHMLLFRYAFGDATTDGIADLIATKLFSAPTWWADPPAPQRSASAQRIFDARMKIWARVRQLYPRGEVWLPEARGFTPLLTPQNREAYEIALRGAILTREQLQEDLDDRRKNADFDNLIFDEGFVEDYIETIRIAKAFSEKTIVMLAPRNWYVASPTPAALERASQVVARIVRETGVPVLDLLTPPEVLADDFMDITHMNALSGVPKLSKMVAHGIAGLLPPAVRGDPL